MRRAGKTQAEKEQLPYVLCGSHTHFALVGNPNVAAKVLRRLDRFKRCASEGGLQEGVMAEGTSLLTRMPRLQFQRHLRKECQKLADGDLDARQFRENRQTLLDAARLPRTDAAAFASKVLRAVSHVEKEYVKPVERGKLVNWAVQGLYANLEERCRRPSGPVSPLRGR